MIIQEKIKELIKELNEYRNLYYNYNYSKVSDEKYDELFDELAKLEIQTGIVYADSPTQNVGYEVQNIFKKIQHTHPMLSLDKTKQFKDIVSWAKQKDLVGELKYDGLSGCLIYNEQGDLISAETRGDGFQGEQVINNAKTISNIPLKINTNGKRMIVDGEFTVKQNDFDEINSKLQEEEKFSHPRNYASGSIRQLNPLITKERKLSFIAWNYIEGYNKTNEMDKNLSILQEIGFEIGPHFLIPYSIYSKDNFIDSFSEDMQNFAKVKGYVIDGLVFAINDIDYGMSLGKTGHHFNHSKAYKFAQNYIETTLRDIRWSVGKSGTVAPTAIFDPVDLLGAVTSRATLHNLSYIWDLGIDIGSKIGVIRANEVIPRVEKNLGSIYHYDNYPKICPSCGQHLTMEKSTTQYRGKGNQVTGEDIGPVTLKCENPNCPAKNLARFVQFVSKAGMNIDGLSEATLEKFIDLGYIKTFEDIYLLDRYKDEIINLEGFGEKSWNKLWNSIQKSRDCKLENYLVALSIPLIGKTAAKTISKHFRGNYQDLINACCSGFDFTQLEDFGDKMNESVHNWFNDDYRITNLEGSNLIRMLNFEEEPKVDVDASNFCFGKTFVVTGKFSKPRSYYEELITSNGGKLAGSVSKKTDFLLTDNPDSGSSKAVKAKSLGIPVLSEEEFMSKVGN